MGFWADSLGTHVKEARLSECGCLEYVMVELELI